MYVLTQINIYPVKSLGGISLKSSFAGERGLTHDRRWMLADDDNNFFTQRQVPAMALIGIELREGFFYLYHKDNRNNHFLLPFKITEGKKETVTIWNDRCTALHYSKEADEWISDAIRHRSRFIYMPEYSERKTDRRFSDKNVSFADAFPYHILGEKTVNDLNERLVDAVPMNRFRPNLVFSGGQAHVEDGFQNLCIGDAVFSSMKPCGRCAITTIDQETGEKGREPLHTLSTYRTVNNNVLFGQYLIATTEGTIHLGDELKVLSEK